MKRLLNFVSIIAIVASMAAVAWRYRASDAGPGVGPGMAVGESKVIKFRTPADLLDGDADLDIEDQLRDWVLYAVVSNSGLRDEAVRNVMFDMPPTRAGFVKSVSSFQHGLSDIVSWTRRVAPWRSFPPATIAARTISLRPRTRSGIGSARSHLP